MKTFLRKLRLSFLAMLCGWIACNVATWAFVACYELFIAEKRDPDSMALMRPFGLGSGIVIMAVWLVVFLPLDLLVRDESWLRQPKVAASAGFVSASALVIFDFAVMTSLQSGTVFSAENAKVFLTMTLLAGLTGTVAAYIRARLDKPNPQPSS